MDVDGRGEPAGTDHQPRVMVRLADGTVANRDEVRQDLVSQVVAGCTCGWMDTHDYSPDAGDQTMLAAWRSRHDEELSRHSRLTALVGHRFLHRRDGRPATVCGVDGSRLLMDMPAAPHQQVSERDQHFLDTVLGPGWDTGPSRIELDDLALYFVPDDDAPRLDEQPFRTSFAPMVPPRERRSLVRAVASVGRGRRVRKRWAGQYVTGGELATMAAAEPDLGALAGRVQNATDLMRLRRAWREGWLDRVITAEQLEDAEWDLITQLRQLADERPAMAQAADQPDLADLLATRTADHHARIAHLTRQIDQLEHLARATGHLDRMLDNADTAMQLLDQQSTAEAAAVRRAVAQSQPSGGLDSAHAGLQAVIDQVRHVLPGQAPGGEPTHGRSTADTHEEPTR